MSNFELKGVDELRARLKQLSGEEAAKAFKSATGAGAKVIREAAIANVQALNDPATPEDISKNIVQRPVPQKYNRRGDMKVRVGVLGGAAAPKGNGSIRTSGKKPLPGGDTYYWRFLEFGTQKVAARPFLRPAMDKGQAVVDAFADRLGKRMDRLIKGRK